MKKVCFTAAVFMCVSFAYAQNGANKKLSSANNIYLEAAGDFALPMSFFNKSDTLLTGLGGGLTVGAGYNLNGWLFGISYSRTWWSSIKSEDARINDFAGNVFEARARYSFSQDNIKKFPRFLVVTPGIGVGVNFLEANYFKTQEEKDANLLTKLRWLEKIVPAYHFSLDVGLSLKPFVPYVSADYVGFFDDSSGFGIAGAPRFSVGFRIYPFMFTPASRIARQQQLAAERQSAERPADGKVESEVADAGAEQHAGGEIVEQMAEEIGVPESYATVAESEVEEVASLPTQDFSRIQKHMVANLQLLERGKYYVQVVVFTDNSQILNFVIDNEETYPLVLVPHDYSESVSVMVGPLSESECNVAERRFKAQGYSNAFTFRAR